MVSAFPPKRLLLCAVFSEERETKGGLFCSVARVAVQASIDSRSLQIEGTNQAFCSEKYHRATLKLNGGFE